MPLLPNGVMVSASKQTLHGKKMNIFVLDEDITKSVQALVDKHVVKMVLETAQLLSTAHRVLDGNKIKTSKSSYTYILPGLKNDRLYKASHINHPCAIWARESLINYSWLLMYFKEILKEYEYRYGKKHKCSNLLSELSIPPKNINKFGTLSRHPLAMPDEYKKNTVVESYRNYYKHGKKDLHSWKLRTKPQWI